MNGQDYIEQIRDLLSGMKHKTEGIKITLVVLEKKPSSLVEKKDDLKCMYDSLRALDNELDAMNDWS